MTINWWYKIDAQHIILVNKLCMFTDNFDGGASKNANPGQFKMST